MSIVTLFFKEIFNVYWDISLIDKDRDVLRIFKKGSI